MIPWDQFLSIVTDRNLLNRAIDRDRAQREVIEAASNESLFIVAGPGSGKTTALSLRVLKLIFVDDVDPAAIMSTTFTRKAATELRSRILGWGDQLRRALSTGLSANTQLTDQLGRLDLNRVVTGTLDSIAEQVLTDIRAPGTQPPIPLEDFVADALMLRAGLFGKRRYIDGDLKTYISYLRSEKKEPNLSNMLEVCREVRDRFLHDQIDVSRLEDSKASNSPGISVPCY